MSPIMGPATYHGQGCLIHSMIVIKFNFNMVCPGYIETEINSDWFASEGGKKQIASFPRRRLMAQEDLDPVISWLTSDASKSVTGSVVTVDDGQSI